MTTGDSRYEAMVLHSTDIAMVFDPDGLITYVTPTVETVSGYRADELVGTNAFDFVHPDDLSADLKDVQQAMLVGDTITREWRLCLADGSWGWYEFTLTDMSHEPAIGGTLAHFRDVTDRHAADSALRRSEIRFQKTVELATDGFLGIDPSDRIVYWNPAAADMFGWSPEEAIGREVATLIVPEEERDLYRNRFRRAVIEDMPHLLETPFEMVGMHRGGRRFPVEVTVVQADLGGRVQFEAFVRDIGARKEVEARLATHGFTDQLTKLPNRALLADRLALAISRLSRRSTCVALFVLDLGGARVAAARFGKDGADTMVAAIAHRLATTMRGHDTVARYSEAEFVVVAEDLRGGSDAAAIGKRLLTVSSASVSVGGDEMHPYVSLGGIVASATGLQGEDLLAKAAGAMREVRESGGGLLLAPEETGTA